MIKEKDIRAAIRSCDDRIRAIEEGKVKWAWGKRQKKRAIELENIKRHALISLLEDHKYIL